MICGKGKGGLVFLWDKRKADLLSRARLFVEERWGILGEVITWKGVRVLVEKCEEVFCSE